MRYTRFETSFCEVILVGNKRGLTNLHLATPDCVREFEIDDAWIRDDDFFTTIIDQIHEYFTGKRNIFDIDLNPQGTDFQKTVWKALSEIPYGTTCSYKDIAIKIGNPKASRAIGMANSKNPIPLIVPCHRVVGANGKLTGFAHGLKSKETLINHELKFVETK
ncbi:MAG: methylated-DNA--[protein]-cysteine S-methyltransferase [Desulfovibrio sp.]